MKVTLIEITWDDKGEPIKAPSPKIVVAHFNPETLKVSYQNQNKSSDSPGSGSTQFVGSGTTKMGIELLFDTTTAGADVRENTKDVAYFMGVNPSASGGYAADRAPPGVRVQWGAFVFDGVVDSMDETLEYFSEEGVPLRAVIALSLTRPRVEFPSPKLKGDQDEAGLAGTSPTAAAQQNETLQSLSSRVSGTPDGWKDIAEANNIDDPLRLNPGQRLSMPRSA